MLRAKSSRRNFVWERSSVEDNVRAGGLFWRNDRGAAEVVPSEQTDSEYIIWHNARTTYVDEKFAGVVKVIVPRYVERL